MPTSPYVLGTVFVRVQELLVIEPQIGFLWDYALQFRCQNLPRGLFDVFVGKRIH